MSGLICRRDKTLGFCGLGERWELVLDLECFLGDMTGEEARMEDGGVGLTFGI